MRKCVHCGFCNATCPTYQLLGDELDGPRGRIYLIKQVLEGQPVTRSTQQHLDRCLTCRNCETTCPSGVEYGRLVDIGRELVDARVERPLAERTARWLLREGLTSPAFGPAVRLGQLLRPVLPEVLARKLPEAATTAGGATAGGPRPAPDAAPAVRRVLVLAGCVQPALRPSVNTATARVLAAAGIAPMTVPGAGCCGALRQHLSDHGGALADMRRNIDAWWPHVSGGDIDAIVINASACSLMVKDYGAALREDPAYAEKAARISALARDLSELLPELVEALRGKLRPMAAQGATGRGFAVHQPCTLQHGQRLRGGIAVHLAALGFEVQPACAEAHLCCGSAGTYSVLQPELAGQLRDRKLANLTAQAPQAIVSANIGCIQHLQSGTPTPVMHWVEALAAALI